MNNTECEVIDMKPDDMPYAVPSCEQCDPYRSYFAVDKQDPLVVKQMSSLNYVNSCEEHTISMSYDQRVKTYSRYTGNNYNPWTDHDYFYKDIQHNNDIGATVNESEVEVDLNNVESEVIDIKPDNILDPIACSGEYNSDMCYFAADTQDPLASGMLDVEIKKEIKEEPPDEDVEIGKQIRMEMLATEIDMMQSENGSRTEVLQYSVVNGAEVTEGPPAIKTEVLGNHGVIKTEVAGDTKVIKEEARDSEVTVGPGIIDAEVADDEVKIQNIFHKRNWCRLTEEYAITWAQENGLVPTTIDCPWCGSVLHAVKSNRSKGFGEFVCRRNHEGKGRFWMAAAKNTIMNDIRINVAQALRLIYCFAYELSYEDTIQECSYVLKQMSNKTVHDWFLLMREVCVEALERKYAGAPKIGGSDKVVEVNEFEIHRRKYFSKRMVEGNWIVCFVERGSRKVRVALIHNDKGNFNKFLKLLEAHVESQTTIITDCYRRYSGHQTLNYSFQFVDPVTETSEDNIEIQWFISMKHSLRRGMHTQDLALYVCEYLWREDCKQLRVDPFMTLVRDIGYLHKGGAT